MTSMTTALERIEADGELLAFTLPNWSALLQHPLRALPPTVRPDAFRLWLCHRHLSGLESASSIAFAVAVWMHQDGLTEQDAAASLSSLLRPERMGSFRFASDLLTALAKEVTERIHRRKIERDMLERRRKEDEDAKTSSGPDEVRKLLEERLFRDATQEANPPKESDAEVLRRLRESAEA
jgi:hypothetical protein